MSALAGRTSARPGHQALSEIVRLNLRIARWAGRALGFVHGYVNGAALGFLQNLARLFARRLVGRAPKALGRDRAPAHAFAGAKTIDQVALDDVCGIGAIIHVDAKPGEPINLADVPRAGVPIQTGDIVFLDTRFAKLAAEYDERYHLNPYLTQDLADHLVEKKVKVLCLDCITVDMPVSVRPPDFAYPIHRTLSANNVLIIENLGDLSAVAGKRARIWAFPLKITGSDAAHVRVLAEV